MKSDVNILKGFSSIHFSNIFTKYFRSNDELWNYFQRGGLGCSRFQTVLNEAKIDILRGHQKAYIQWDIKNIIYRIQPEWYEFAVKPSPDDYWIKLGLHDLDVMKRLE